ncbi:uncharacterized protein VTP21DRAFT_1886 [Calcarisporiella thermophila]|uniref:uncharacterized protein n=1 Tax=Calcarisporiella thermophila TaxID=911321 RepID=UPI0037429BDA
MATSPRILPSPTSLSGHSTPLPPSCPPPSPLSTANTPLRPASRIQQHSQQQQQQQESNTSTVNQHVCADAHERDRGETTKFLVNSESFENLVALLQKVEKQEG